MYVRNPTNSLSDLSDRREPSGQKWAAAPTRAANRSQLRQATKHLGFTLIEAIVALVLISTTGMVLFSWINTSIQSIARAEEANTRNQAIENTIEFISAINPMVSPEGETDFGSYKIKWKSTIEQPIVDGTAYPSGQSLFEIALYKIEIVATTTEQPHWFALKIKQVGFKKVRELKLPFDA